MRKVHLAFSTVTEAKLQPIIRQWLTCYDFDAHDVILVQWLNPFQGPTLPCELPVTAKFLTALRCPFSDQATKPSTDLPVNNISGLNINHGIHSAVSRVKVWRIVVVVVHVDRNPEEFAYLWHVTGLVSVSLKPG